LLKSFLEAEPPEENKKGCQIEVTASRTTKVWLSSPTLPLLQKPSTPFSAGNANLYKEIMPNKK